MSSIPYVYHCLVCILGFYSFVWNEPNEEVESSNEKSSSSRFPVYWNVPTFQCHKYGLNFTEASMKWGIRQNEGDQFRGEEISILYDPGEYPALLEGPKTSGRVPRNGGVPQEGSLSSHLKLFRSHLVKLIPNPNFKGLAIIDFEHWRPVWRQMWGSLSVYRDYSKFIEKRRHPFWFPSMIEREASYRYTINARTFLLETLRLAKLLRPRAKWGYYGYPFCFNYTPNNNRAVCEAGVILDNDGMEWLFKESSALYPSLYLRERGFGHLMREKFMKGRLSETRRVSASRPIYPYLWYKYRDTHQFVDPVDMMKAIQVSKDHSAAGVVIWGASNDVNTEQKCVALAKYLDTILGPSLVQLDSLYNKYQTTSSSPATTTTMEEFSTDPPTTMTERPTTTTVESFTETADAFTSTTDPLTTTKPCTTTPDPLTDTKLCTTTTDPFTTTKIPLTTITDVFTTTTDPFTTTTDPFNTTTNPLTTTTDVFTTTTDIFTTTSDPFTTIESQTTTTDPFTTTESHTTTPNPVTISEPLTPTWSQLPPAISTLISQLTSTNSQYPLVLYPDSNRIPPLPPEDNQIPPLIDYILVGGQPPPEATRLS